jgi:hypothetical protein
MVLSFAIFLVRSKSNFSKSSSVVNESILEVKQELHINDFKAKLFLAKPLVSEQLWGTVSRHSDLMLISSNILS